MIFDQFKQSVTAPLLLVDDAVSAARWEAYWLAGSVAAHRPPVHTVRGAIARLVDADSSLAGERLLLSRHQSATLWREIVSASPQGSVLVSAAPAAAAAEEAWYALQNWGVAWETLRADSDDPELATLLDWCRTFYDRLNREQWSDHGTVLAALATGARHSAALDVATALSDTLPPRVDGLFRMQSRTGEIVSVDVCRAPADTALRRAEDPRAELKAAAEWVAHRLTSDPMTPVAVVIRDARRRRDEIDTVLGDAVDADGRQGALESSPLWTAYGQPVTNYGAPGAALNALELICGDGRFGALSSFLRSPFFPADDRESLGLRSRFETDLRQTLIARWRFADAYRRGGLRTRLERELPGTATRIAGALNALDRQPARLTPTEWTDLWEDMLRMLGWQVAVCGTPPEVVAGWDQALRAFASTSAIVGRIGAMQALTELRLAAESTTIRPPMTLHGVHVLERPEQVGPGYAGVWICDFTDRHWPESMRLNPLLPAKLQRAHRMPGSTPELAHKRSESVLARLLSTTPEAIFSVSDRHDDVPMRSSRMLTFDRDERIGTSNIATGYAARRIGNRRLRLLTDRVPPAQAAEISGGTRLLELQAGCPLRAFCEIRLGARALERPWYGISPRVRGIVLHRILERLLGPEVGDAIADLKARKTALPAIVETVIADQVPWRHPPWDLIRSLESDRAERAVAALLAAEDPHGAASILAVEAPVTVSAGGAELSGRIDRVDRLADGRVVIFDYKTGAAPSASGWFGERLLAPQMPAYAISYPAEVAAIVVAALRDDRVDFRAAGDLPAAFPVRARPALAGEAWASQLIEWRQRIGALVAEFVAGDVRVAADRLDAVGGPFAPLVRDLAPLAACAQRPAVAETGHDA